MWSEYLNEMIKTYLNKQVKYDGLWYMVVDIDANGELLINKKNEYGDLTAIGIEQVEEILN